MKYLLIVGTALGVVWLAFVYSDRFVGSEKPEGGSVIADGGVNVEKQVSKETTQLEPAPEELVEDVVEELYEVDSEVSVEDFEESEVHGASAGVAVDATAHNHAIGLAGGAGGSFAGRRGAHRRRLGTKVRPIPPAMVELRKEVAAATSSTFSDAVESPFSTFSIDVDTASYSEMRRHLKGGRGVSPQFVRTEEFLNYFTYSLPDPEAGEELSLWTETGPCPWNEKNQLLRVGVGAPRIHASDRKKANLVFLIDVSGSMAGPDRLGLLKNSMKILLKSLNKDDVVSIVTYSNSARTRLQPTAGDQHTVISQIIDQLSSGGSTNGAGGLQMAYDLAKQSLIPDGVNRVILASDGDFNVGVANEDELGTFAHARSKEGIAISVLGFGMGNLNRGILEKVAQQADGHFAYIDDYREAKKVFEDDLIQNLQLVARDVKIQVEFNPTNIQSWRLIGYENRQLAKKDFADDAKDASDMGPGSQVTALYELVLRPRASEPIKIDRRYATIHQSGNTDELLFLKVRYKPKDAQKSRLLVRAVSKKSVASATTSVDFRFAAAVAGLAGHLAHDADRAKMSWAKIVQLAQAGIGRDSAQRRAEFVELAKILATKAESESREEVLKGSRVGFAIEQGLSFLTRVQAADGYFFPQGIGWQDEGARGQADDSVASSHNQKVEATALALLAFTGVGNSHRSGPYRRHVTRACKWLRSVQLAEGRFSREGENALEVDVLATLALVDIFGITKSPLFLNSSRRGVKYVSGQVADLTMSESPWSPRLRQHLAQLKFVLHRADPHSVLNLELTFDELSASSNSQGGHQIVDLLAKQLASPATALADDANRSLQEIMTLYCDPSFASISERIFELQTMSMIMAMEGPLRLRQQFRDLVVPKILRARTRRGIHRGSWAKGKAFPQTATTAMALLTLQYDARLR